MSFGEISLFIVLLDVVLKYDIILLGYVFLLCLCDYFVCYY